MLAAKTAGSRELLQELLDAHAAEPGAAEIEVLLCGLREQEQLLRDGRADVALLCTPFNVLAGFDDEELSTEGQVAILPAGHALAARTSLSVADISDVPGLPLARWPRHDGTYSPGPGPEIRDQTQLAQLVALGRTVGVLPEYTRSWPWAEHAAVPLVDAPPVTTHIARPPHSRSRARAGLIRTAVSLALRPPDRTTRLGPQHLAPWAEQRSTSARLRGATLRSGRARLMRIVLEDGLDAGAEAGVEQDRFGRVALLPAGRQHDHAQPQAERVGDDAPLPPLIFFRRRSRARPVRRSRRPRRSAGRPSR